MDWVGEATVGRNVVERGFALDVEGRRVTGILWTPENADGTRPLVLIGHGASLHKRTEYVLSLARRFVRHHGFAAVSIDGPDHGDRGPVVDILTFAKDTWRRPGVTDDTVADWQATIAAVQELPEVGRGPMGYWGLSMGAIFGIPLVAAEPRIEVAVLGLVGAIGPTEERLLEDAAAIACPVFFLQQWDDELFTRESTLKLFDAVGTPDKRLHVHPGGHVGLPREAYEASEAFVATRLTPSR